MMTLRKTFLAALAASLMAMPALAADIMVDDPYARSSSPSAKSGAAFMMIKNTGTRDDRLVAARSEIAARVELHTHIEDGDVMRMVEVEEGFELPAGGEIMMERGGKHVMFLGLTEPLVQGETVDVTLTFEQAGDVVVTIPVDLERMPKGHGHGSHDHGTHGHGHSDHGAHSTHSN